VDNFIIIIGDKSKVLTVDSWKNSTLVMWITCGKPVESFFKGKKEYPWLPKSEFRNTGVLIRFKTTGSDIAG